MTAQGFANVETSLYHWYYNGYYAGLQGNSFFNVNQYKQIYPELASLDNPAAHRHFVECGYYENRVGLWSLYCGSNNGGCHSSTTCTNANAQRTCGPCPAGHVGDGSGSCPVDLSSSNVLLNANVYSYDYYISANADLAGLTADGAAQHWIFNGVDEGRQAIASFNVNDYKRIYADAAGLSNRDAVSHFISNSGRVGLWVWYCGNNNGGCDAHDTCSNSWGSTAPSCGMCPFPAMEGDGKVPGGCYPSYVFNYKIWSYTDYITINTDLALYSEEQARNHWRTTGINEGRQAIQGFAVLDYKRIYSDIAPMSNADAIKHYVETGNTEKRVGIWSWWCGNGANGGCDPLVTCTNSWAGWKPSCGMCPADYTGSGSARCYPSWVFAFGLWDPTFYQATYADVASLDYDKLRDHWFTTGISEGRQAISSFSVQDYKRIYSDVAAMSNYDAMKHWTTTGNTERRVGIWAWWCGNGANGGCDAMVTCSNGWTGTPSCGFCPAGYKGTGSTPGSCTLDTSSTSGIFSSKVYNYNFYITAHADLSGFTQENAGLHWANSGISEGRQAVASFIVGDYKRIYADAAAMTNRNAVLDYVTKYNRVGLWSRFCGNGANGGCDSLVTCTNSWGDLPPSCGMCPVGYTGTGSTPGSCVATPTTPPVVTNGGGSSSGTPTTPPAVTSGGGSSSGTPTTAPVTSGSSSTGTYTATGLLSSYVFKYEFYISANPDLASLSVDAAAQHWVSAGVNEGRQAHADFNVNEYKRIYPAAAALSNSDAVLQYASQWYNKIGLWKWFCGNGDNGGCDTRVNCSNIFGARAPMCSMCPTGFSGTGDKPNGCYPRFVTDYRVWQQTYYTDKYQLTGLTYTTASYHFYSVGIPAGHQAIATFSVSEYKQIYPDVAGMSNLDAVGHYVNVGYAEKRAGTFSNWCGYTPNGGCDPLTTCGVNVWGEKQCGWCPIGYTGRGETGCVKY